VQVLCSVQRSWMFSRTLRLHREELTALLRIREREIGVEAR
jgi:hypothetical protein